jgi:molybdate transport system substrate-binding protein
MHTIHRAMSRLLAAALLLAATAPAATAAEPAREPLTIFAAASLTNVLQDIGAAYAAAGAATPRFSFAASSVLARQIEAGARADVFFSADQEWMDYLAARGLIRNDSRRDILGNRLVLIAPAASTAELHIARGFPLVHALGKGRLATGDPDYVPAGKYARSALMTLGVWGDVADRLVRADNVRVALAFVARGETPFGIVYATDAAAEPKVRVVDTFPADSHLPITYPVAVTSVARPEAAAFISFTVSEKAAEIFRRAGFLTLGPAVP